MKSRDGQSKRGEEKKKEHHKRECLRRKKMQMREKAGKSRNTMFFQWFVAPEGRKVGSLKRRVWSQLAKWLKTPHVRSTFGSWDVEKVHTAHRCSTKHISKSKCTKHTMLGPLLEIEMSKKCTSLWRQAHSKWTCTKRTMLEPLLGVEMSKKCALFWREAHVEVISWEELHFGASDLQVCWDDFAWQVQHFVWPGITFSWQAQ